MKIFISYSRADAGNFASHIHGYLIDNNHAVFTDVNSITIGDPWARSIEENIFECDIFVVILTPDSLRSSHVEKEVLQAQKEKKIIVPCKHQYVNYNQIKWGLENIQGIEFSDKYELALNLYAKITNYENLVQQKKREETSISEDVHSLHQKGRSLYGDSKFHKAIENFDMVLKIDPNYTDALFDKGRSLYKLGKFQDAIGWFDKALTLNPKYVQVLDRKGNVLRNLEKYQEAIECYDQALKIDPTYEPAKVGKKKAIDSLSKSQSTIQQKSKLQDKDDSTNLARWYLDKAKDFEGIEQYDLALKQYEKAIKREPFNFLPVYNKALLLERIEKYEEALQAIEQAIDIEPKNTDVWYHKALILEKLQKYNEALKSLNTDLQLDSKDIKSWTSKAKLLEKMERYDEALVAIDEIIKMDSANIDAFEQKGKILTKLSRYQEAIDCYDIVLAIDANNKEAIKNKTTILDAIGTTINKIKSNFENKDYSTIIELFKTIEKPINNLITNRHKIDSPDFKPQEKEFINILEKMLESRNETLINLSLSSLYNTSYKSENINYQLKKIADHNSQSSQRIRTVANDVLRTRYEQGTARMLNSDEITRNILNTIVDNDHLRRYLRMAILEYQGALLDVNSSRPSLRLYLYGPHGIGKSTLISRLQDAINQDQYGLLRIPFFEIKCLDDLLIRLESASPLQCKTIFFDEFQALDNIIPIEEQNKIIEFMKLLFTTKEDNIINRWNIDFKNTIIAIATNIQFSHMNCFLEGKFGETLKNRIELTTISLNLNRNLKDYIDEFVEKFFKYKYYEYAINRIFENNIKMTDKAHNQMVSELREETQHMDEVNGRYLTLKLVRTINIIISSYEEDTKNLLKRNEYGKVNEPLTIDSNDSNEYFITTT